MPVCSIKFRKRINTITNSWIRYILIGICLQNFIWAGVSGKIYGRVTDRDNGDPLPGVNVVVVGTSQGSATDLEGEYYILNLRPGTYSVSVSMIGYQTTISRDVRILSDHTVTLNFELSTKVLEASAIKNYVFGKKTIKVTNINKKIVLFIWLSLNPTTCITFRDRFNF